MFGVQVYRESCKLVVLANPGPSATHRHTPTRDLLL